MIPVFEPVLGDAERRNVLECVESGWVSSGGDFVSEFEERMAGLCGRQFGVAVNNGTSGLIAAFKALDLDRGSEVIMPSFMIISCALAAVYNRLTPVFVDSDPITWNMEAEQIRAAITPRTRAVLVVHTYGLPVDMDAALAVAKEHDLLVIEDYSQAIGSSFNRSACGSFGTISVASTYANKAVTTGEGGVCVTDDADLAEKLRDIRNLCFGRSHRFLHSDLGYNFRMTNLQAAVGVGQLERIDEIVATKIRIGHSYTAALDDLRTEGSLELPAELPGRVNSFWMFGCVLGNRLDTDAESIRAELADRGIDTRAFFYPLHRQPPLAEHSVHGSGSFEVADRLAERGFYLPSGLSLEDDVIAHIAEQVGDIIHGL